MTMTLEAIKQAVVQLSEEERKEFAYWFEELAEEAWDKQIECDFSPGGRGMPLLAELEREIAEGKTRPIEEVCAERRNQKALTSITGRSPGSGIDTRSFLNR